MAINIKEQLKRIVGIQDHEKKDLFELAEQNDKNINTSFANLKIELKHDDNEELLSSFMVLVQNWNLTINMDWRKVLWVCKNGRICNTYDMAKYRSETTNVDFEASLKEECKSYYSLRINLNK